MPLPYRPAEVDAGEQHAQVGGAQLDAVAAARGWEAKGALCEALVPGGQAVVEELETVAALTAEDEEVAGERVGTGAA